MAEKRSKDIEITHFINPHLFWYKIAGKSNESQKTVIEQKLSAFAKRYYSEYCAKNVDTKISVNDNVGVYYLNEQKWIRAIVDEFDRLEESMVLWAEDYGIPMKCSRNLVISLDDELQQLFSENSAEVYQAGIFGVMPASYKLNVRIHLTFKYLQKVHFFDYSSFSFLICFPDGKRTSYIPKAALGSQSRYVYENDG